MSPTFRVRLVQVHRWVGLTVGLVIVMIAVTGAGIVFRPQLDPLLDKELTRVKACNKRQDLDRLVQTARLVHPGGRIDDVLLSTDPESSVRVSFEDKQTVYLDPCSDDVLGVQNRYSGLFGTLDMLHRFRFMDNGKPVAGSFVLVFALIGIIGGLLIWWPRTIRAFKATSKYNPRLSGRASTLNLHNVVGLYVSLVILTSTLTGMPIAFKWVRHGINSIVGSVPTPPPPKSKLLSAGQSRLGAEELWQRAQALMPDQTQATILYPLAPNDPMEYEFLERDAPHPEAHSHVYLDAYSGAPLRVSHYADNSLGDKIYYWNLAIHTGLVGGFLVQLLLGVGALGIPVLAYTGFSSYIRSKRRAPVAGRITVRVSKVAVEAEEISSFELAEPAGRNLPAFSAGSHIDVHIREGLIRQYSLCNDPSEKHRYLIGVLRAPNSRGGSCAMHDDVREGDLIQIGEPKNHFPLAHAAKRSLLIAGGIGITPVLCMAERLSNIGAPFEMHYCSRTLARTAFVDRIRQSAYADKVTLHMDDGPVEQRLDLPKLLSNPNPGTHLYVCGPSGFMDYVIDTAAKQGWASDRVHREYFAGAVQNTEGNVEFDVKLASTGKVYRIGKEQTVAEALMAHGVDISTACGQGVCGTCVTRIIEGDPEHRDMYLTEEERAKNDQFMPCCSRAISPMLVLDL